MASFNHLVPYMPVDDSLSVFLECNCKRHKITSNYVVPSKTVTCILILVPKEIHTHPSTLTGLNLDRDWEGEKRYFATRV
jgi:hypothetical protein